MSMNDEQTDRPAAEPAAAPARTRRPIDILRERVGERTPEEKEFYKNQSQLRKRILEELKQGPRTIPELASRCGIPSEDVVWHMMAMRRYGKVVEEELRGDYYSYRLREV